MLNCRVSVSFVWILRAVGCFLSAFFLFFGCEQISVPSDTKSSTERVKASDASSEQPTEVFIEQSIESSTESPLSEHTSPEKPPLHPVQALVASGSFQEVQAVHLLQNGSIAVLLRLDSQTSLGGIQVKSPPAGRHTYLAVIRPNMNVVWVKRLISSRNSTPGGRFKMWQLGSSLAISTQSYASILDPDGLQFALPDASTPDAKWNTFVFRIDLQTQKCSPSILRTSGTITTIAGDERRWFIGGTSLQTLHVEVNGKSTSRSPQKTAEQTLSENAYLIELKQDSSVRTLWMLDGSGSSHLGAIIPRKDGVFIAGGFGGFAPQVDSIFDLGQPTEKTIVSHSSDDDPAWDIFVARLNTSMKLKWVRTIKAYSTLRARGQSMIQWGNGIVLHASKSGYDLIMSQGEPDERKEKEPGLVMYGENGKLKGYLRASGVQSLKVFQHDLLVHGLATHATKFGTTTLPTAQTWGAAPRTPISYLARVRPSLKLQSMYVGGWLTQENKSVTGSWSFHRIFSPNMLWSARGGKDILEFEKGSPKSSLYGKKGESHFILLRYPLRYPIP